MAGTTPDPPLLLGFAIHNPSLYYVVAWLEPETQSEPTQRNITLCYESLASTPALQGFHAVITLALILWLAWPPTRPRRPAPTTAPTVARAGFDFQPLEVMPLLPQPHRANNRQPLPVQAPFQLTDSVNSSARETNFALQAVLSADNSQDEQRDGSTPLVRFDGTATAANKKTTAAKVGFNSNFENEINFHSWQRCHSFTIIAIYFQLHTASPSTHPASTPNERFTTSLFTTVKVSSHKLLFKH